MLDFDIVTGIGIIIAIIVLVKFVLPYLKKKGFKNDLYGDIKLGLMLFGYAFREEKIKEIANKIYNIVSIVEVLDLAPEDKQNEAVELAFKELMEELKIQLDEEALKLIIDIAVAYLPPTNKAKQA